MQGAAREEAMTIVHQLGAAGIQHELPDPAAKQKHAGSKQDAIVEATAGKGSKAPPFPPCLVNLLIDASHPHHFALTDERLELVSGGPGSCLDAFKTHVRDTVGTDAYLRAMGRVDLATVKSLFAKSLSIQGHEGKKAGALAQMAAQAGLILLEDRIASDALVRIQAQKAACSVLAQDRALRGLMLVKVSAEGDRSDQVRLLERFGLSAGEAAKVAKLVSSWIPQEIVHPTPQSEAGVAAADKLLAKGVERALSSLASLEGEIRHWQISKEIDLVADLGPAVEAALDDLGLPAGGKGSLLADAIEGHVAGVEKDRLVEDVLELGIGLVCGCAGRVGAASGLPQILADKKRLDDLTLLAAMGLASTEAVDEARVGLLASVLETLVDLP
jgi:hypothetical protein